MDFGWDFLVIKLIVYGLIIHKDYKYARYPDVKFKIDCSSDHIEDHLDWMSASCAKLRDSWHKALKKKKKKF